MTVTLTVPVAVPAPVVMDAFVGFDHVAVVVSSGPRYLSALIDTVLSAVDYAAPQLHAPLTAV